MASTAATSNMNDRRPARAAGIETSAARFEEENRDGGRATRHRPATAALARVDHLAHRGLHAVRTAARSSGRCWLHLTRQRRDRADVRGGRAVPA
jgi:hypothetical protein